MITRKHIQSVTNYSCISKLFKTSISLEYCQVTLLRSSAPSQITKIYSSDLHVPYFRSRLSSVTWAEFTRINQTRLKHTRPPRIDLFEKIDLIQENTVRWNSKEWIKFAFCRDFLYRGSWWDFTIRVFYRFYQQYSWPQDVI